MPSRRRKILQSRRSCNTPDRHHGLRHLLALAPAVVPQALAAPVTLLPQANAEHGKDPVALRKPTLHIPVDMAVTPDTSPL